MSKYRQTFVVKGRAQGQSWASISEKLGIGKGTAQRAFYGLPKNPTAQPTTQPTATV